LRAPAILGRNSLGEPCRGRYVPAADAERFIAGWELTRDYLISQPGYVDTALHQAVTPNADFQFVNIGRWQTAEDFLAATHSQGFREAAMGLTDFRPHPGLYRIVRT
jgi:heme-degrading monooxygenase HmoA